ncbi:MAG: hypothetical protein ACREOJ_10175, partial [Gemmatimonadaceae bacterium]
SAVRARTVDEGRIPLRPLVPPHDVQVAGSVMHDENVRVTAALVHHPSMVPAFAYRFDAADRSIVVSGDTTPSENLVALASHPEREPGGRVAGPPRPSRGGFRGGRDARA